MILADRVVAIEGVLAEVPHAFGGALALAYYAEPRATVAIDINVFVPVSASEQVLGPLVGLGVTVAPGDDVVLARDEQVRIWWDRTPVDLFFAYDPFHDAARAASRRVGFGPTTIPVLSPEHLVVCKTVSNRGRDWIDIEAILRDGTVLDIAECLRWVGRIVGDDDDRYNRLAAVLTS